MCGSSIEQFRIHMKEKPLKVLIVSQYFWPENMRINDLAAGFVERGHQITVLTGLPNYPEGKIYPEFEKKPKKYAVYERAEVVRVPILPRGRSSIRLALNYLSFFVSASVVGPLKLKNKEFDVVFVYAVSPIMAAIPAIVIGRLKRAPVFVWVLDLWPETLEAVGIVKEKRLLSVVGKGVSWIYNRTDYILLQSQGFYGSVKNYCTASIDDKRLVYFPSWAEDDFSGEVEKSDLLEKDDSTFTIVFAGNIGESQDFPAILKAVEQIEKNASVRWVIVGDGRASSWLKTEVESRNLMNVHLLGRHPLEKMPPLFAIADALLVSLRTNEVFSKTVPGKVQAYLASGKPIIAMIDGEAARVIEESGAGMACGSGDAAGLANIVQTLANLPEEKRAQMGAKGKRFYLESFSKERLFDRLESLFRHATLRRNEKNE